VMTSQAGLSASFGCSLKPTTKAGSEPRSTQSPLNGSASPGFPGTCRQGTFLHTCTNERDSLGDLPYITNRITTRDHSKALEGTQGHST
jgi:hypothetical protein